MGLKKFGIAQWGCIFATCVLGLKARGGDYVLGMNFDVTHSTIISQLGVYDGGTPLTTDETVGIFDDSTGNLVGSELVFGPGYSGTQVGDTLYESLVPFTLSAGDYSVISLSTSPPSQGATSGSSGSSSGNLGDDLSLPGGDRFNSGTIPDVADNANSPSSNPLCVVDPQAPDGGATALLLGGAMAAVGWMRRRF